MALLKRKEFLAELEKGQAAHGQLYCFFGERYLIKETADLLVARLSKEGPATLTNIDGESEDPGQTLARLTSFSLLPGRQIIRVNDTRLFHSREVIADLFEKAVNARAAGKNAAVRKNILAMAAATGLKIKTRTPLSEIGGGEWQKLFGFARPEMELDWADSIVFAGRDKLGKMAGDISKEYLDAFARGLPPSHLVILTAETVDKRKRFFLELKKLAVLVDCTILGGSSAAAKKEQQNVLREMMQKTLAELGKTIEPAAAEKLMQNTGFHPVAVVLETEKLAHFTGDGLKISQEDVGRLVVKNREDALFELTEAFVNRRTAATLQIQNRLLERGFHALAILATLRGYCRKLLIFRHLQLTLEPRWRRGMRADEFQKNYLPAIKASGSWQDLLAAHPFALYRLFTKASEFSCAGLRHWLTLLLEAEYRLKGSGLPEQLILEELILTMQKGKPAPRPGQAT